MQAELRADPPAVVLVTTSKSDGLTLLIAGSSDAGAARATEMTSTGVTLKPAP
jgi:hypothetical protein